MAEDTPAAAPAAESSVERAPAESKAGAPESAPEPSKEEKAENANGSEEKPSGKRSRGPRRGLEPPCVLESRARACCYWTWELT